MVVSEGGPADEAARAARAGLGNMGGGGIKGAPVGGLIAPINIKALVFSACAAAAIKLLFSASDSRGDRNMNEGSNGEPIEP